LSLQASLPGTDWNLSPVEPVSLQARNLPILALLIRSAYIVGGHPVCIASIVMTDLTVSLVDFKSATPELSTASPAPERLLAGNPTQSIRNYFSDTTGQFFAGVWHSTPGRWRVRYSENEFCHITSGRVRIEDELGAHWLFTSGDSFVIPAGFTGTWQVLEPTSKLYVIFEAATK
jgi:uncharacterized protein